MKEVVKALVSVVFSLCMILSLGACGHSNDGDGTADGSLTVVADTHYVGQDLEVNPWGQDSANSNGSGIYFNGQLWVFYSTWYKIKYRTYTEGWDDMNETDGSSERAISPIIYKGTLYIFWVKDQKIRYKHYTGKDVAQKDTWSNEVILDTSGNIPSNNSVTPVYNPGEDRMEVYYTGSDGAIYSTYSTTENPNIGFINISAWAKPGKRSDTNITEKKPAAVAVKIGGTYKIMLAYKEKKSIFYVSSKIYIAILENNGEIGTKYEQTPSGVILEQWGDNDYAAPHLVDLGNGEIAMLSIWRESVHEYEEGWFQYRDWYIMHTTHYDMTKHDWWQGHDIRGERIQNDSYAHNAEIYGTPYYNPHKKEDGSTDLEGYFIVFQERPVTALDGWTDQRIHAVFTEFLGEWKKSTDVVTGRSEYVSDWADENLSEEDKKKVLPVIGVLDMPPFVFNNNQMVNSSSVSYNHETSLSSATETTISGGVWTESSEHNPVKAQIDFGLVKETVTDFKRKIGIKYTATDFEKSDPDNPLVMVFYLAPKTLTTYYRFYTDKGVQTDRQITVVQVTDASITYRKYERNKYFPDLQQQVYGDLSTYSNIPPAGYLLTTTRADWSSGVETELTFSTEKTTSEGSEQYIKGKFGYVVGWGGGVEGEYRYKWSQSTSIADSIETKLRNERAVNSGDYKSFEAVAYWYDPNKNGFWVPADSKENGSKPWFVTYSVSTFSQLP